MDTRPGANSRPRSGPRRDETARLAVLHAADDLLAEVGFNALSMEGIARRAGVAKQTIYRWWPTKAAILLDTLIEDSDKRIPVPAGPATRATTRRYLRALADFVIDDPAGKVLVALIAEADHDPTTAEHLRDRYLQPRRERERELFRKAADAGAVHLHPDIDTALDAVLGLLVLRSATGAPVAAGVADRLIDALTTTDA